MGWPPAQEASGTEWQAPLHERWTIPTLVRYIAGRALKSLPNFSDFEYDYIGTPAHHAQSMASAIDLGTHVEGLHREELLVQDGRIEMNRVSGLEDEQDHPGSGQRVAIVPDKELFIGPFRLIKPLPKAGWPSLAGIS